MNLTLRTKGILALGVLVSSLAAIGWFLAYSRQDLYVIVQEMERIYAKQALLERVSKILTHTLVETQAVLTESPEDRLPAYGELYTHMQPVRASLDEAEHLYPLLAKDIATLEQAMFAIGARPDARRLSEVRDSQQTLIAKLHDILTALQQRSTELAQRYHDTQQRISLVSAAGNIAGVIVSGAVILVFFTRLASDIRRLQDRAVAIVAGYAGPPLVNRRRDEVGGLINAVNRMQVDLRRWERQEEISRQQRIHQEKMAAVGSLAAAIGHEISNPIAAISGVAQAMMEATREDDREAGRNLHGCATQVFKETQRLASIMRQLAGLTRRHSPDPEPLDLNALIQSTCGFIRYDPRFHRIEFEMDLGAQLPAVTAVADHVTQVLMNLLINAADAMEDGAPGRRPTLRISTRPAGSEARLAVSDNGRGMSSEVLARAFEESFTTKAAGRGRGIGLFLCKKLIEEGGGRIELASTEGAGTTARLFLPLCRD